MSEDGISFTVAQNPVVDQVQVSPSVSDYVSWYCVHLGHRSASFPIMGQPAYIPGFVLEGFSRCYMIFFYVVVRE